MTWRDIDKVHQHSNSDTMLLYFLFMEILNTKYCDKHLSIITDSKEEILDCINTDFIVLYFVPLQVVFYQPLQECETLV